MKFWNSKFRTRLTSLASLSLLLFLQATMIYAEGNNKYQWAFMALRGSALNIDASETISFALRDFANAGQERPPEHQGDALLLETLAVIPPNHSAYNMLSWADQSELSVSMLYRTKKEVPIYEVAPSLVVRWNKTLSAVQGSFAFSQGFSYANIPPENQSVEKSQNFLHFAFMELTLSWKHYPQWQILSRIHHRSGLWGVYGIGVNGSNVFGVGIRYFPTNIEG